ncbi:MAG: GspMb/PilO family protein [Planctomycetota bacterium]|jgi:hypothetical protein
MKSDLVRPLLPALVIVGSAVFGAQTFLYASVESHAVSQRQRAEKMQLELNETTRNVSTSDTPPMGVLVRDASYLHETYNNENPLAIHEHVMRLASEHSVEIESVEPTRARSKVHEADDNLGVHAFEIRCVGSYPALLEFLHAMERESPWMLIGDWSMVPFAQDGRPTVRCTLRFERFTLDTQPLVRMAGVLEEGD